MKWYLASRTRHQKKLAELAKVLEERGEEVLADWLGVEIFTDFEQNLTQVQDFTEKVVASLLDSEIFVLISDPEGTDMFIELGIFLAHKELSGKKRIYIVGEYSRRSLMQLHPAIIHARDIQTVLEAEGISQEGATVPVFD